MSIMAPVIVFAYNRPVHLQQTLDYLAQAEGAAASDLWIFCDGPKPESDPARIDAAREVARDRVWTERFKSVRVELAATNKGLANSIIEGVSTVIAQTNAVIVVEDDVLVSSDFLRFMNDCLGFYQSDRKVGSITGFSPFAARPPGYSHDVMVVPRNCSQCWATWRDRWHEIDWGAHGASRIWQDHSLRRRFNAAGNDRVDRLRRQLVGEIDSWSIRFGLWQILSERHSIYPVQTRVSNIGYDGSGVHTRHGENINSEALPVAHPYKLERVSENPSIVRRVARIYGGPPHKRILRAVRTWVRLWDLQ